MKPPLCICHGPSREPMPGVHVWYDQEEGLYLALHPSCPIHQEQIRLTKKISKKITEAADPLKPSLSLLCKLASIAVHADEMTGANAHPVDVAAFRSAVEDQEVREWLKSMGPFVPVKR